MSRKTGFGEKATVKNTDEDVEDTEKKVDAYLEESKEQVRKFFNSLVGIKVESVDDPQERTLGFKERKTGIRHPLPLYYVTRGAFALTDECRELIRTVAGRKILAKKLSRGKSIVKEEP